MDSKLVTMIFSLVMFATIFYGIAAFATWEWHPALWTEWLRAAVAIAVLAGWVWDARR